MAEQSLEQLEQEFQSDRIWYSSGRCSNERKCAEKVELHCETVTQSGKTRRSYYADCGTDRRYRRESEPEGADRDVCG